MIGNSRGLKATPLDMLHFTQFLMSYQGGAWTRDGIELGMDKDVNELLNDVEKIVIYVDERMDNVLMNNQIWNIIDRKEGRLEAIRV